MQVTAPNVVNTKPTLKSTINAKTQEIWSDKKTRSTLILTGVSGAVFGVANCINKINTDKALFMCKDVLFKDAPAEKGAFLKHLNKAGLRDGFIKSSIKAFTIGGFAALGAIATIAGIYKAFKKPQTDNLKNEVTTSRPEENQTVADQVITTQEPTSAN